MTDVSKLFNAQQLQLLQLCFGEHEFGVICHGVDEQDPSDAGTATPIRFEESADVDGADAAPRDAAAADGGNSRSHRHGASAPVANQPEGHLAATEYTFDFEPFEFVEEKLASGVSLEDLCRDLEVFIQHLQMRIMSHVHKEVHEAFVTVSGQLVSMNDEMRYTKQRIGGVEERVASVVGHLSQVVESVEKKLHEASVVETERLFDVVLLKCLLQHEKLCDAVDELPRALMRASPLPKGDASATGSSNGFQQKQWNHHADSKAAATGVVAGALPEEGEDPSAVLGCLGSPEAGGSALLSQVENVVLGMHQLRLLTRSLPELESRRRDLEDVREHLGEATGVTRLILERVFITVYRGFMRAPSAHAMAALRRVLELYDSTDETQEFCRMLRDAVARDFFEGVISWRAASQARLSLPETLKLLQLLHHELKLLLEALLPVVGDCFREEVCLVSKVFWPMLCETLMKKMVNLYDSGIPDAFHARFTAAHALVSLLEDHCRTVSDFHEVRQSTDMAMWSHKWNTEAYHVLRSEELAQRLEVSRKGFLEAPLSVLAADCRDVAAAAGSAPFHLQLFAEARAAVEWFFASETVLFPCIPRFVRDVLQHIHTTVGTATNHCHAVGAANAMDADAQRLWMTLSIRVDADCRAMSTYLNTRFSARLTELCGAGLAQSFAAAIAFTGEACTQGTTEVTRALTARVEEECFVGLQNIRSVRSSYVHLKKTPKEPSWFVASISDPILRFHSIAQGLFAPERLHDVIVAILEEVTNRFASIAKESLVAAKRTEEGWEKVRGRRGVSAAAGAGAAAGDDAAAASPHAGHSRVTLETASDLDKILVQIYMDAMAYVAAIRPLGVAPDNFAPLKQLLALLRRANWILGENIPEPAYPDDKE